MEHANINSEQPITLTRKPFSATQKGGVAFAALLVAVVVIFGLLSRRHSNTVLGQTTERAAIPAITTLLLKPSQQQSELVLPGNTQAFVDAPIYARTNGYLKKWYFDIGAHVRQGQLLAEIETPELDQQLKQAEQDLSTAKQNEELALTTAVRWQNLVSDDAVSKQEAEQYESDYKSKKFITNSASANVDRIRQLQSYEKIYAPFSGVITARNTDIGDLIDSGAGSPKELFHLASVQKLRIFVSIPEADSAAARLGSTVDLTLDEYPGKIFHGTIARTSDSIDGSSRTLKTEVDVDNTHDEVKTGAYVRAYFKPTSNAADHPAQLTVPANALLFRSEGLQVAVLQNGRAQLVPITIGRDYGSTLEVLSGLKAGDRVILNPSDSLTSGTPVADSNASGETAR